MVENFTNLKKKYMNKAEQDRTIIAKLDFFLLQSSNCLFAEANVKTMKYQ